MRTRIGLAFLLGGGYLRPWPHGPRVGSTRSDACGEQVRPGGGDGCLISVKLPTMGSMIGENQAVPWAGSWKQELHRNHF